MGGDNLIETERFANLGLDYIAPKGDPLGDRLRSVLVKSGMGSELSVIAALRRLGKERAEDGHVAGKTGSGSAKDRPITEVLYGPDKEAP